MTWYILLMTVFVLSPEVLDVIKSSKHDISKCRRAKRPQPIAPRERMPQLSIYDAGLCVSTKSVKGLSADLQSFHLSPARVTLSSNRPFL